MQARKLTNRRQFLMLTALGASSAAILAACAPAAAPTPTTAPAPATTAPTAAPKPTEAAKPTAAPKPTEAPKPAAAATPTAAAKPAAAAPVTIEWWNRGYVEGGDTPETRLGNAARDAFQKAYPNIKVKITGVPWTTEGTQKVDTALQSDTGPDMFRVTSADIPRYADWGVLSPIDEYLKPEDKADYTPSFLQAVTIKGKMVAYPLWFTALAMYINLDLFAKKSVAPPKDGKWTFEEFVEKMQKLTYDESGKKFYGYLQQPDEWALLYIDGARQYSPDLKKWTLGSPEGVSALQKEVDLNLKQKVMAPEFPTAKQQDVWAAFKDNRNIAVITQPPAFINTMKAEKTPPKWDLVYLPKGKGEQVTSGGLGLVAVRAGKDKAKVEAAHVFSQYITGPAVAKDVPDWWLATSCRKSAAGAYAAKGREEALIAGMAPITYIPPSIKAQAEVAKLAQAQIDLAIAGKKTPEQALADATKAIQPIVDKE